MWEFGEKKSFPTVESGSKEIVSCKSSWFPSYANISSSIFSKSFYIWVYPPSLIAHSSKVTGGPIKELLVFQPSIYLKGQTVKPLGTQIFHLEVQALSWQKGKISLHIASTKKFTAAERNGQSFFSKEKLHRIRLFTVEMCIHN